ncbi:cytidylyltransferase domain-containing protein [Roseovarius sp. C7]|uniref:acylneuraminate cytidylyltransferase family protein n=1 Tax=Roseovarius sp. C7 TaxID=3398643 RepID=UPI0039F65ED0
MLKIATICARGGSVGVPGKNIRPLLGKPLIVYTIEQALQIPGIDFVFVSTNSEEIAEISRAAGATVPFLRPDHLATSDAPKLAVLEHLADWVENSFGTIDLMIDLDPTSPLRLMQDIEACLTLLDDDTGIVISGYEADKNPYFNMVEYCDDGDTVRLVKRLPEAVVARQHAPKVFSMNASIYVYRRDSLRKGIWNSNPKLHIMPRERSIDIDEPLDFEIVELLMKRRRQEVQS